MKKKVRKMLSLMVVTVMMFCLMNGLEIRMFTIQAGVVDSGTCGTNVTWSLDTEGLLTISGSGAMDGYSAGMAPWHAYESDIHI